MSSVSWVALIQKKINITTTNFIVSSVYDKIDTRVIKTAGEEQQGKNT